MNNTKDINFLLCIENRDCDDIVQGKVYRVIPDPSASEESYVRIVDESGEDYLYPESCFVPVELPKKAEKALYLANDLLE